MARRSADRAAELTRVSRTDPLTGVLNRRGLIEAFPELLASADVSRAGTGRIGALLLDIDRFKQLNDRFGHAHGDAVLQQVASVLAGASGDGSVVGRIGGEELVALLDGDPAPVADAVRTALADRPDLGVTVSIGMVHEQVDAEPAATLAALLLAADRALYRAKGDGRDRVRLGRVVPSTAAAEPPVAADAPVPVARDRTPSFGRQRAVRTHARVVHPGRLRRPVRPWSIRRLGSAGRDLPGRPRTCRWSSVRCSPSGAPGSAGTACSRCVSVPSSSSSSRC